MATEPKAKNSLNLYVCEWEDGWYHGASCAEVPMGWCEPQGPFKTFAEAMADFTKCLPSIVDDYKEAMVGNWTLTF